MKIRSLATVRLFAAAALLAGCAAKPTQGADALLMGKFAGDLQQTQPQSAVPTLPAVRVTDDRFNPVEGVTVTFAVKTGGGSVSGATAVTDINGIARVGGWTLGPTAGTNSLTASVDEAVGSPATFLASAVVPPVGEDPKGPQFLRQK